MKLYSFDFLFEVKTIRQFRDKCESIDHLLSKLALVLTEENQLISDTQYICIEIAREYGLQVN